MKHFAIVLLVLIASLSALFATGSSEKADTAAAAAKDTLVVALDGEPQQLDPYAHSNQNGLVVSRFVYEPLLMSDLDGNIYPFLATEYEMVDDLTLSLTLRDDVFFHDGSKMTSEDVAYSLATAAKSSFTSNLFGSIDTEAFQIIDDTHLVVRLKTPNAALIPALASHRCAIISKNYYETASAEDKSRKPMGTGPMVFGKWVSGDRIELEKNPSYWGNPVAFDHFVARVIVEGSSRAIELETGGVDIAFNLPSTEWERIESNPKTKLISGNTQGISFVTYNGDIKPYDDYNVRLGLSYALNKPALVEIGWGGKATVADSYYSSTIIGHKETALPEYNPEKAKEYLAKAGYNEKNHLKLVYTTYDSTLNRNFSEAVQSMWSALGCVDCEIQFVDLAQFTTLNNSGAIAVSLMTNTAAINDPSAALLAWPIARTISVRHNDQKVQDYLDKGISTYDVEERIRVYGELQDYLAEHLYTFPIAFPGNAYGASAQIKNLPFYPNVIPDLTVVEF